jgi:hypothetical protein
MADSTVMSDDASCQGRTCLQWAADGELTRQDRDLVMARLARVDREVASLLPARPDQDSGPCDF